jgi:dihydroxyacetone kinase DhaKLM complex PTS-EIIA-like component DhaM
MIIKQLVNKADDVLASYDFGSAGISNPYAWRFEEPETLTKILYICFEEDDPDVETEISFYVRFTKDGEVEEAYAQDMRTGDRIGRRKS